MACWKIKRVELKVSVTNWDYVFTALDRLGRIYAKDQVEKGKNFYGEIEGCEFAVYMKEGKIQMSGASVQKLEQLAIKITKEISTVVVEDMAKKKRWVLKKKKEGNGFLARRY